MRVSSKQQHRLTDQKAGKKILSLLIHFPDLE